MKLFKFIGINILAFVIAFSMNLIVYFWFNQDYFKSEDGEINYEKFSVEQKIIDYIVHKWQYIYMFVYGSVLVWSEMFENYKGIQRKI